MLETYVQVAVVAADQSSDLRALGGAVTLELCGSWDHEPPCPVAAHLTESSRRDDQVDVRILFATEPEREPEVRARIERALSTGCLVGPHGVRTEWSLRSCARADVLPEERELTARWAAA